MVNHVAFLLDASGSMMRLQPAVREVFAKLMDGLASEEAKSGIETRVHIYSFGYGIRTELRNVTPKQASVYRYEARNEGTALINSTMEIVGDLEEFESKKDDVSFLVYVLTDGQETENKSRAAALRRQLTGLNDDWTMAIMVPDEFCRGQAETYGFPADNIAIWEASAKGAVDMGMVLGASTQSYYTMRSLGQKSTKCLFLP